ncbi:hypothetical protein F4805DRAFT_182009 [Annulohypoxylon moriforme]|nr:hypothetical protein F4805DRAFT_182009 [Annulohypoxylon moriforme]
MASRSTPDRRQNLLTSVRQPISDAVVLVVFQIFTLLHPIASYLSYIPRLPTDAAKLSTDREYFANAGCLLANGILFHGCGCSFPFACFT